jgi:hypothetical protein
VDFKRGYDQEFYQTVQQEAERVGAPTPADEARWEVRRLADNVGGDSELTRPGANKSMPSRDSFVLEIRDENTSEG